MFPPSKLKHYLFRKQPCLFVNQKYNQVAYFHLLFGSQFQLHYILQENSRLAEVLWILSYRNWFNYSSEQMQQWCKIRSAQLPLSDDRISLPVWLTAVRTSCFVSAFCWFLFFWSGCLCQDWQKQEVDMPLEFQLENDPHRNIAEFQSVGRGMILMWRKLSG